MDGPRTSSPRSARVLRAGEEEAALAAQNIEGHDPFARAREASQVVQASHALAVDGEDDVVVAQPEAPGRRAGRHPPHRHPVDAAAGVDERRAGERRQRLGDGRSRHGGIPDREGEPAAALAVDDGERHSLASVPLTGHESWTPLAQGEILVFRSGEVLTRARRSPDLVPAVSSPPGSSR